SHTPPPSPPPPPTPAPPPPHAAPPIPAPGGAPPPRHAHPKRQRPASHCPADPAQPEDADAQLAEFPHRDLQVSEFHPRPPLRHLELAQPVEAAGEVRYRGDRPIRERIGVPRGGGQEHDASPL